MNNVNNESPASSPNLAGSEIENVIVLGEMKRSVAIVAFNSLRRQVDGDTFALRRTSDGEHTVAISPAVYGERRQLREEQVQAITKQIVAAHDRG